MKLRFNLPAIFESTVRIEGGSPFEDRVLTSLDSQGNAEWKPLTEVLDSVSGIYHEGEPLLGQLAYWTSTPSTVSGTENLHWNHTNTRLGIGNTNPQETLHVTGTVRLSIGTPSAGQVLTTDSNGTATWQNLPVDEGSKWTLGSGDDIYKLNGNVGIGTASPGGSLNILKAAGADAVGGSIILNRHLASASDQRGGAIFSYYQTAATQDMLVFTVSNNTTPLDITKAKMVIGHLGNVGIGTNNPGQRLVAETSDGLISIGPSGWRSTTRASILLQTKSNNPAEIDLLNTQTDTATYGWQISSRTGTSPELNFYTNNNNSFTQRMQISNAGTVTATGFSGAGTGLTGTASSLSIGGNASTATTLQTSRTINGTNFNGSANITTANWGTARTFTIGSTGKSVNGSGNVSWSLGEIGAAASSHDHLSVFIGDCRSTAHFPGSTGSTDYMPNPNDSLFDKKTVPIFSTSWAGSSWGGILTVKGWSGDYAAWQLAGGASTTTEDNWYLRTGRISTWNAWRRIWHSGDFSSTNVSNWNTAYADTNAATDLNTVNTLMKRNSSGDVYARLFRSTYTDQTTISGAIAYRISTTDNYIRFCSDGAAIRTFIGAIGGSGASGRVAYWNGTNSIASTANFTYSGGSLGLTSSANTELRLSVTSSGTSGSPNPNRIYFQNGAMESYLAIDNSNSSINPRFRLVLDRGGTLREYIHISSHSEYIQFSTSSTVRMTINSTGVGIGISPSYKLDVNGDVRASAYYYSSDKRLKKDVELISSALSKIKQLKGVKFKWKKNNQEQLGLIAQDVEKIFPEIVSSENNKTSFKAIQYGNLVAPLIEAVKELDKRGELQEIKIKELEKKLHAMNK